MNHKKAKLVGFVILIGLITVMVWYVLPKSENKKLASPVQQPPTPQTHVEPSFNLTQHSLSDPSSPWVVVNKKRPLPGGFTPSNMVQTKSIMLTNDAALALDQLLQAASSEGVNLKVISGYRSFASQTSIYNNYVRTDGQANADTYSARPGFSEHQTGLAADLGNADGTCDLETCFGQTPGGQWLKSNAASYGFIIRYLEGKTSVTGYQYEPWHVRFVGKDLAQEIGQKGTTMEEIFQLPAAPDY